MVMLLNFVVVTLDIIEKRRVVIQLSVGSDSFQPHKEYQRSIVSKRWVNYNFKWVCFNSSNLGTQQGTASKEYFKIKVK